LKILIIENEIYLAQSIATKLSDLGHICEMHTTLKDSVKSQNYDVVLLSTNISGQDFMPVIDSFKNSIVILMVSYISNDTVSKPLAAGAKDYILKPFMIEELVRKINHYQEFEKLKRKALSYEKYLSYTFSTLANGYNCDGMDFPIFITSTYQKHADSLVFKYAKKRSFPICFVSLADASAFSEIEAAPLDSIVYIINYHQLKKSDKKEFLALLEGRRAIVASTDKIDDVQGSVVEIKNDANIFDQGEILPIEEYVRFVVTNYQGKYPDTELSKKLGISRKSLWEKRKKYDISKKK
jgi:CheY-like chemotaxis protein